MKRFPLLFTLLSLLLLCTPVQGRGKAQKPLMAYVDSVDNSFRWDVVDSIARDGATAYRLRMVSQTWRGFPWIHEMVVVVPPEVKHREVLLHVTGGSADKVTGEPNYHGWDEGIISMMGHSARHCNAVTAVLWQVPRQPLYDNLYEDALMSYTFHQYQNTGDRSWPLMFPMVKSVVRAMDAVEQFAAAKRLPCSKGRFVINGASKRGWTTWMTAATEDRRVAAIAPMVIDILHMPVSVPYQKHMYGSYSREIHDYVDLGLTDVLSSSKGGNLVDMVDPYSYRSSYTMPKWLMLSTNDEFWTVDAVKNYMYGIPGLNRITYVPNAGHGMGDRKAVSSSLEAFFHYTIHGGKYPSCSSSVRVEGDIASLKLKTGRGRLLSVQLWQAESDTKDFRKSTFAPVEMPLPERKNFSLPVELPRKGYKAFFAMLTYAHPAGYDSYTLCTRMYTADAATVFDAPYQPQAADMD